MGKALCFSTSMHFMVSKSSAECTAVTKLRVRIEMADNFTCNVEFQFAQPATAGGRVRGGEFHHRTLHRNAILAREAGERERG